MREQLAQTSRLAALESEGAVPFRLMATFSTFDYLGKPAGEGTLEEIWLRPGVAHRVITFRGKRSDQVANGGSARETQEGFEGSFMERRVIAALLDAVPEVKEVPQAAKLDYRAYKVNSGSLDCVIVNAVLPDKTKPTEDGPATAYCSDPVSHILRLKQERYDFAVVYNKLVKLGDHYVSEKVDISQRGKLRATLNVTSFAAAHELTEQNFRLPANVADLSKDEISLPEEVVTGANIKKKQPVYPDSAKQNHVSGTVFLSATIGKQGSIEELDVISSPSPDLTASAIEAVKQWKYKPYLVGGVPQEVDTVIRVNYSFGY